LLWIHLVLFSTCFASNHFIAADDPAITYVGRVILVTNENGTSSAIFDWSGIEIQVNIQVNEEVSLYAHFNDPGNFYNVFVNNQFTGIFNTTSELSLFLVTKLQPGTNNIAITKRTEAAYGVVTFFGFNLEVSSPFKLLDANKSKQQQRRLEFLGASMTCGYGIDGTYPCSEQPQYENNFESYGPVSARALGAEYHAEAWSGKGVVRNYASPNTTSPDPFPTFWNRTLAHDPTIINDFTQWVPDALMINLGTNDFSTKPWPPQTVFEDGLEDFIDDIQTKYSSNTTVVLTCGPMVVVPLCNFTQNVVDKMWNNGKPVYYVSFDGILNFPSDYGCDGHPNHVGQQKMAEITIPVLKKILDW